MNLRRWFHDHSLRLLAIRDTPEAIAGGVAIGIFFWFPPVFGLKTLGAIFLAWLTRSNILAAVIAVTLHDVLVPFMLVVYRWEYCLGYWLLSVPRHWPHPLSRQDWLLRPRLTDWRAFWRTFSTIGRPLLLGSVIIGVPVAAFSFVATRIVVRRHHRKKQALSPTADQIP
jgi:uncharacterized protein